MISTDGHFPGSVIQQGSISTVSGERIVHWELTGAIYHISLHLADSVPADQLAAWKEERMRFDALRRKRGGELSSEEVLGMRQVFDERIERYLSSGFGCCALREPLVADAVACVLEHDNGERYDLHEWTIMPNHVHVVVAPKKGHPMKELIDQWKRVSAHAVTRFSAMRAPVWQRDFYSRIIRTREEYGRQMAYVWHNPESAGLAAGFLRKRY